MRIWSIVLAAGRGERMGGPKALLAAGGEGFLARCARLLHPASVESVVAVVGHEAERVVREAGPPADVQVVINPRYAEGMLTSIRAGLDAAGAGGADAVLVHPVDHPLVEPETVARVLDALLSGAVIAVPRTRAGAAIRPASRVRPGPPCA